jgi:glycosyltransferase involved in cell wall biosynthesis
MQLVFHLLSFEGPDAYARAGGIASRVSSLAEALAAIGVETHLWFLGDPLMAGHETHEGLHLHRWCQWMSRHYPAGVYEGEGAKVVEYGSSLPPVLVGEVERAVESGDIPIVLAEEWHTVNAVLHLDELLRRRWLRQRVSILWNANNIFGFESIDWRALRKAAVITTVSRYMKHVMGGFGTQAVVIPNGLAPEAFGEVSEEAATQLGALTKGRTLVTKIARWDPDKRWIGAVQIVASLKRAGSRPLWVARGGLEPHGREVLQAAAAAGLKVCDWRLKGDGIRGLISGVDTAQDADVLNLCSHLNWDTRRLLYRQSEAVLANSGHEPFGLVGLETMAAGGVACTGCSGEDYAVPGHNALVLQTDDPAEFLALFRQLRTDPDGERAMRDAGRVTARQYAWPGLIRRTLLPRALLAIRERDDRDIALPDQRNVAEG